MGSRVELFEQISREGDREGLSIRALAERHGMQRRAVRRCARSVTRPSGSGGGLASDRQAWAVARLHDRLRQRIPVFSRSLTCSPVLRPRS